MGLGGSGSFGLTIAPLPVTLTRVSAATMRTPAVPELTGGSGAIGLPPGNAERAEEKPALLGTGRGRASEVPCEPEKTGD